MAKKYMILSFILVLLLCGCTKNVDKKIINIAVVGCPSFYSDDYEKGIKRAYADVCKEYKNSGYEISVNFYNDNYDYETADKITAELVKNEEVTAIIASSSAEITKNQMYQTNKAGKILICPYWIYDSALEEKNYNNVFSLNYSYSDIGIVMRKIAKNDSAKKWAICYAEDEISRTETKAFNKIDDDIEVVDSIKINTLESSFNQVVNRWSLLGVEGVVFIPYDNEGFNLLYKLKEKMPQLCVISDSSLDNNDELEKNRKYFDNVYVVDSFYVNNEESKVFKDDIYIDTWEVHGYNALRMTVDTAIKNNTTVPWKIAKALHNDGYVGELENYKFNKNGSLNSEIFSYVEFKDNDMKEYIINKK